MTEQYRRRYIRAAAFLIAMLMLIGIRVQTVHAGEPLMIAWRGYHKAYPENTLQSYIAASRAGFAWVEIDVQETKDHQFVIMHDPTLARTTNDKTNRQITAMTLSQIRKYRISGKYTIPTLQEALATCRNHNLHVVVHLKNISSFGSLTSICSKYMAGISMAYQTNSKNHADQLRRYDKSTWIFGAHYNGSGLAVASSYGGTKINVLNMNGGYITTSETAALRARGLVVCAWPITSVAQAYSMYKQGVTYFITTITPDEYRAYAKAHYCRPTTFTSVAKAGTGTLLVKWKAVTPVNFYQVQIADNSQFDHATTKKFIGTNSGKLYNRVKGKTYYLRVRSVRWLDGKCFFSNWSKPLTYKYT